MGRFRRIACIFVGSVACALAGGCCHTQSPSTATTQPYRGPTLTMGEVVSRVNANAQAIPTLWARHYFAGRVVDEKGHAEFLNAEGILLVYKPGKMRLVARKVETTIFDLGTDGERFWMIVPERADTMWWGWNRNIGRPCAKAIPLQPESLLQVLGIGEFDTDFTRPPVPVMRFSAADDAYVFVWNQPYRQRWAAVKEVWYDRQTLRPRRVIVYDENGRAVLEATLERHERVEVEGKDRGQWPWVATLYNLSFPESGSKITLTLRDMRLENEGVPAEGSIRFPDPKRSGASKEVQIDKDCVD